MALSHRTHRRSAAVGATLLVGAGCLVAAIAGPVVAAAAETVPIPSSGNVTVSAKGNGHGHGMSQWGAQGAALKGRSSAQILAFYYPGTTQTTLAPSTIRVLVSGAGTYTTVGAGPSGLRVTGVSGALPTTGISRYRLVPSGGGLALQRLGSGSGAKWTAYRSGLPSSAYFSSSQNYTRLYFPDGSSTSYRGSTGAVRSGSGELTINRATLDQYTEGVTPRESPASWQPAAVHAQAVAARTYGRNAVESHQSSAYDICDTTSCQVYGGMHHYSSSGTLLWSDDPAAISGNNNLVLRYHGATIFAQFSASNGGWTVSGGQPYLVAKADPYDSAASGDPSFQYNRSVAVSGIAGSYGLARVSSIEITHRDGHGVWGGRVLSAVVVGKDSHGTSRRVATTGFGLQSALGLGTNWFRFAATVVTTAPSAPRTVKAAPADAGAIVSWQVPANLGNTPITGYRLTFGTHTVAVGPTARSAFVGPRQNGVPTKISVRAVNAKGAGPGVAVTTTPVAAPQFVHVLRTARLFDTRTSHTRVDLNHPLKINLAGRGNVPVTGARAVQFALSILHPTESGTLRIRSWGSATSDTSAISYRRGEMATVTVTVPLVPSGTIAFQPTRGSVQLLADQMSYSGPAGGGAALTTVAPRLVRAIPAVPTGAGTAIPMSSVTGVPASATAVVVSVAASATSTPGWLRVWRDGVAVPTVNQIAVSPAGANTNTVLVPLGTTTGAIRLAASSAGIAARVTLVGVIAPPAAGLGRLESFPPNATADDLAAHGTSLHVGSTVVNRAVLGAGQIPATGVRGVLLHLTVSAASAAGSLWVYPTGTTRPTDAVRLFAGPGRATSTVLVPVGSTPTLSFVTSGPNVTVAVDAIGYVTTS